MKTLFLHIGTLKTATSSIQSFCEKNKSVLESKGYCYPDSVYQYPLVAKNRNAHFMVGMIRNEEGVRNREEEKRVFSLGMAEIHKCFQKFDNIVMSDENIWFHSVRYYKDLWNILKADAQEYGYTIKIIVYLRRQDEFLTSRWNQLIKMGSLVQTWEEHVKNASVRLKDMLNYEANVNRISKVFGKENVFVRRFSKDSFYKGTIYDDFFQCIGLELTDEYEELKADSNLGLKGNTVEIMRVMHTLPELTKYNNSYWRTLLTKCSEISGNEYKCSMFSKEEAEEFINLYREGNERLAADFIGDEKPLFHYDVKDLPKWEKDNEYMIDDLIRVFTMLAYDSHERILALQERVKTLENRLTVYKIIRKGKRYIHKKMDAKNK